MGIKNIIGELQVNGSKVITENTLPAVVTVDNTLSSTSTNPVQNKVINTALGNKVDKVQGKSLSTNDYTTEDKIKLDYLYGSDYSEGLEYTLSDDGTYYIVNGIGTCTDADLMIPPLYNGLPVTTIGDSAFAGCYSLTNIVIPNGVTSIGNNAFQSCFTLTSAVIPDSITSIGQYLFYGCPNLNKVDFGNGVTSIGYGAFGSCNSLTNIEIPNSVTSIDAMAFYQSSITSITIPNSVTSIGSHAFGECSNLTIYCEVESQPEGWDSSWWNSSDRPVIWGAAIDIPSINASLKRKVDREDLADVATSGSYNDLTNKPTIPSISGLATETYVDNKVASKVDKTTTVNGHALSENVTVTKSDVGLGNIVNTGDSATPVSGGTTKFTTGGAYTELAKKVDKVQGKGLSTNDYTTEDKIKLDYLYGDYSEGLAYTLSDDGTYYIVTGIGECTDTDVAIPPLYNELPVTSIDVMAFYECSSLTSVVIPNSIASINDTAFMNCTNLKSVTIPDDITSIGRSTFSGCSSLTSIVIPDSVTSIGQSAFQGCSSLKNITIPDSVTSIEDGYYSGSYNGVFSGCTSLTNITIPSSVTYIGSFAFSGCHNLTIFCEAKAQPEGWNTNWNFDNLLVVWGTAYIADGIKSGYRVNELENYVMGVTTYSEGLTYTLNGNGTYALTGIGTFEGTELVIPPEYEGVPVANITGDLSNGNAVITKVVIPNSVNTLSGNFRNWSNLTEVYIPSSVINIGSFTFDNCVNATIYCEVASKPSGWYSLWNGLSNPSNVVWNSSQPSVRQGGLSSKVNQNESDITELQTQIAALEARIAALEGTS